ncbi:MAG: hypothetical protein ACO1RX_20420, partial [Candidatus Sericytochromatia bacterium]
EIVGETRFQAQEGEQQQFLATLDGTFAWASGLLLRHRFALCIKIFLLEKPQKNTKFFFC